MPISCRSRKSLNRRARPVVDALERRPLLASSSGLVPPVMPQTPESATQVVKVLVLDYAPLVPSAGNLPLHQVLGWSDPQALAAGYKSDLEYASGGAVQFQIVDFRILNELPA